MNEQILRGFAKIADASNKARSPNAVKLMVVALLLLGLLAILSVSEFIQTNTFSKIETRWTVDTNY